MKQLIKHEIVTEESSDVAIITAIIWNAICGLLTYAVVFLIYIGIEGNYPKNHDTNLMLAEFFFITAVIYYNYQAYKMGMYKKTKIQIVKHKIVEVK